MSLALVLVFKAPMSRLNGTQGSNEQIEMLAQVIRAVERRGERLDRERIKRTVQAVESAYRKSRTQPGRNSNLERIKFWLGLPNTYYDPF